MASDNFYITRHRVESLTVSDIHYATDSGLDAMRHALDLALRMITTEERARAVKPTAASMLAQLPTHSLVEDTLHEHS